VKAEDVLALAKWDPKAEPDKEIAFHPARVLMQDFTGVPAVVDLAAMREAIVAMGGDPARVNPLSPADLVIDHSVQVDNFASSLAFGQNVDLEYERTGSATSSSAGDRARSRTSASCLPGTGICHQVNLEYLAKVVFTNEEGVAYPDTLVGTDSHTTMINGLGVLGWGVGGIEAEAALLGQPVSMLIPEVVGMKLFGRLPEGATATDLVLTVTQMLRKRGVVGKFVEFYGPGLAALPLTDRATIANMAPEYGATMGFFPVDGETVKYLEFTGRKALAPLVEAYCRAQGLWRSEDAPEPRFSGTLELDLGDVVPSLAGPKRPQDRIALRTRRRSSASSSRRCSARGAPPTRPFPSARGG
jgi:aconitase (EC 4.2.1.3)